MAGNIFAVFSKRARRFYSLSPEDRRLLIEAALLPLFISAGFRLAGVPGTQSRLRRWAMAGQTSSKPLVQIASAQLAQSRIRRVLGVGGTCLTRSLTLWAMLLRRNTQTDLKVGFRKSEGKFEGHAWLEYQGTVLNDSQNVAGSYEAFGDPADFDRQLFMPGSTSSWR